MQSMKPSCTTVAPHDTISQQEIGKLEGGRNELQDENRFRLLCDLALVANLCIGCAKKGEWLRLLLPWAITRTFRVPFWSFLCQIQKQRQNSKQAPFYPRGLHQII